MKKRLFLIPVLALTLAACNQTNTTDTTAATAEGTPRSGLADGEIVYVRMDSLMSSFDMYKELGSAFEEKSNRVETDLTNRGRSLEREVMSAQERVQKGLVTRLQAQSLEEELGRKQQAFMNYRDQLLNELAEEEQVFMNRISNSINLYMQELNKGNRFKMVISTSAGGPILIADPAFDVTAEAIEGLNAYYAANKENL